MGHLSEKVTWLGVTYTTILASADTNGAMSIVESESPPQSGPPRHIHQQEDEVFVILTGQCDMWLEGTVQHLSAGQAFFVPRGKEHTFRITGHLPCRHLVILTPGGFEGFFAAMAAGHLEIPKDMPTINQIAASFHLKFTGPPL